MDKSADAFVLLEGKGTWEPYPKSQLFYTLMIGSETLNRTMKKILSEAS